MAKARWLTIIGLGEDGPEGLSPASRKALAEAEVVMGPARHLNLLEDGGAERVVWPVPFADGLDVLDTFSGQNTVVLASGDPFWFGAGRVLADRYGADEWRAFPGLSAFSLAAARLGWALENTTCLGLHAAPFTRLRPHLVPGHRILVTVRDGEAVAGLAAYLSELGFGDSHLHVMEALGGPRERIRRTLAGDDAFSDVAHPVLVAISVAGKGEVLTRSSGQADNIFETDGQMTKRPVRAITLSSLAPKPYEHLWDIGSGTGTIALEWMMAHPSMRATAIEADQTRADRIRRNALALGQDELVVVEGRVPEALLDLTPPQAVFVGGGLSLGLLDWLWAHLPSGTRVVANAVTLDTEALLTEAQTQRGGDLLRIELSAAAPLGAFRGWKSAYPVVQWSVTR